MTERQRRTKILATLGPATDPPGVLEDLFRAGVNVVRLNFSHGDPSGQAKRAAAVRLAAQRVGAEVGILADLPGPKIRVERFAEGKVVLKTGDRFDLVANVNAPPGDVSQVGVSYLGLPGDVEAGDVLLLDDGLMQLKVVSVEGERIVCTVLNDGVLSDRKGLNKQGGGLSLGALTERDRELIAYVAENIGVDFIAVSFCRNADDMNEARRIAREHGCDAALVSKIERTEAIENLAEIVDASDVVMVARGDLGVEIGDAELPGLQKKIIRESLARNKVVITATQMLQSMVDSPIPTRAEVLDVANAVMDGTDAVMLSAETASGKYPVKVVEAMARVCIGAEGAMPDHPGRFRRSFDTHFERTDEAIAMATAWTARNMRADAILSLTESGSTALMMSRSELNIPIFALTRHEKTRRRMALCRGVYPVDFAPSMLDTLKPLQEAVAHMEKRGSVKQGQRVIMTKGDFTGPGGTNAMKIVTVGEF